MPLLSALRRLRQVVAPRAVRSDPARARAEAEPRPARRRRPRIVPLEQLAMDLGPERPRWTLSRRVEHSPHRARILERVGFVRRFFPELAECTIRLGMAEKRGILGWGSLDPGRPGIWVRPRRLSYFTIAHELTHLLQARGLVPRGERACDLWAAARSPLLNDTPPGYLRLPSAVRRRRHLEPPQAAALHACAGRAIAAREAGERRYLLGFEREIRAALSGLGDA
jgi:hypothetical protein